MRNRHEYDACSSETPVHNGAGLQPFAARKRLSISASQDGRHVRKSSRQETLDAFRRVRSFSQELCQPLMPEDMVVQSMPDASPIRWHLAHTAWFFETFILRELQPQYRPFHEDFQYLFNSYYNAVGRQFTRADRGLLTRPSVQEVFSYRASVDDAIEDLILNADEKTWSSDICGLLEIGMHHEQQHQELMLTDVKHLFSRNPLAPAYLPADLASEPNESPPHDFVTFDEQLAWIGNEGSGFCFDNEFPRHRELVESFELGNRMVTCGEYLEFVEAGGYEKPEYWLSLGWQTVCDGQWRLPFYWFHERGDYFEFTLHGRQPLNLEAPASHISFFEADAYARWREARLPTESEWELASANRSTDGAFVESGAFHPQVACLTSGCIDAKAGDSKGLLQMMGDCWEWTSSPYVGYPGYRPPPGAVGEYNGKFMCNQFVLRGGSVATSLSHIRPTYRNFFPPEARWQFSGFRLAR